MENQDSHADTIATCLICKHALVSKLNIFKTRTNFSKTLVSSKLSKLLQATFKQEAMPDTQDICSGCSALINQVDECEIKLMALENEVKLKYKMPFPIEVHSRRSEGPAGAPPPPAEPPLGAGAAGDVRGEQRQPQEPVEAQEFSFISIDGSALENPTIVLEAGEVDVDGNNVVVYREPEGPGLDYEAPQMTYLAELDAADLPADQELPAHTEQEERPPTAPRQRSRQGDKAALDRPFTCELCADTFHTSAALRSHRICHAGDRSFPCRFCRKIFPTNIALHYHWNEEHPLKLQPCPHCDKRFINKSNLNQHINTHQKPRFQCEMPNCRRQFHTRGDLRKHIVFRHSDEKNFPCADCELSFKANWLLTRHRVRVHQT